MEEILGKRMRNRCLSLLIVFTLILCTPATDNGLLQGIFPQMFPQKAQAAAGEIDESHPLNAELIKDANLLAYLKEQTGKGDSATVRDLRSLGDVVIPGTVTDLTGLGYARRMTSLDLSACTASRIEASEFSECSSLRSVKLPATVKTIDQQAFNNCMSLEEINLGSVDILNDQAFVGCAKLNDASVATMKDTLEQLGDGVFSGCASLTTAKVPIITGENAHTVPASLFNGCKRLSKVVFCDSSLTNIADSAFADTGNLKFGETESVKLPGTITAIGSFAFSQSGIKELDLSETKIPWISDGTFSSSEIESVIFPNTVTDIRTEAFKSSYLRSVTMPNTVTKLGEKAFQYAGQLLDVKLSAELTEIPDYAFQGAGAYDFDGSNLGSIEVSDAGLPVIPGMKISFTDRTPADSKLQTIGISAFNASTVDDDTFLSGLTKLTTIKEFAFSYTNFEDLTIPACVETVGKQAFDGMYWLEDVVFAPGSKVTELPEMLFGSDKEPARIGNVGVKTYADLVLKRVQLPSGLKSIGKDCFGNCYSLKTVGYSSASMVDGEVRFPTTLETIGEKAFEKCGLYKINNYDESGKGYTNQYCGMKLYPGGFRKVTVPDSVTTLGEGAFRDCPMMEELSLGNGITEIPKDLCNGCGSYPYNEEKQAKNKMTEKDALATPTPGAGASSDEAVYTPIEFIGLQQVKLPDNLATIGESAFSACYALEGFTNGGNINGDMPGKLTDIGKNAFYQCKSLESVTFPSSLKTIGDSAFAETSQDISEQISSASTGKNVQFFHQYSTVGLGRIDFQYATNLASIGAKAFSRSAVTTITFPTSVESLPNSVCEDCYNLDTVTVPRTVTDIGDNAFKNTYCLNNITIPLSANWSKSIFEGVAAYKSKTLTVNANPGTKEANVYVGKDNVLDFTCIKNFNDVTLTVTDSGKDVDDPNNNLLTHDSNEYISVAQSREGNVTQISVRGKKTGSTTIPIQVSGNINLAGDKMAENNTTKLNDSGLLLTISQRYNITVTQNPVSVLEFSVERLAEEAQKPVLYLEYGSTKAVDMKAVYKAQDATQATTDSVEWSVEDSSVVQLDGGPMPTPTFTTTPDGTVEGCSSVKLLPQNLGDTVVSVKSGEKKADCAVRVRLPLTGIALTSQSNITSDINKEIELAVDNTRYSQEHLALLEQNPNYGDVLEFTSDNEDVAKVEKVDNTTGKIKTVAEGTAKIKVTSLVTGRNVTCTVTVTAGFLPPAVSVQLSQDKLEMYVGDEPKGIQASVLPADSSQTVTWSSSNEKVATVVDGIITAVAPGTTSISAKTENNRMASCTVTVKQHVDALTVEPTELNLEVGKSSTLKATVLPANASDKVVAWSSSDESVATVTASGSVRGIKAGTATITATADGKTATCTVKVNAVPTAVKLSQEAADLEVGKQLTLTASVEPAEASQAIEWKSSNESVATVDKGVVTAVKEGNCNITATATGSSKNAICRITVKAAGTGGTVTGPDGNTSLAKVKLTSAKNVKKKSIKVKWKAVAGAAGYQVACGSKKKTTTKTTVTFKKLKKKKKYAVKVRAYVVVEGKKVYGKWSKAKKVKVKK